MLNWMLEIIKEQDARKVFVHASDYMDPVEGDIYRDARDAYIQVGFTQEVRQPDYYAPGESMLVYGMRLGPREVVDVVLNLDDIKLTDVDEIPETNDAYWFYGASAEPAGRARNTESSPRTKFRSQQASSWSKSGCVSAGR